LKEGIIEFIRTVVEKTKLKRQGAVRGPPSKLAALTKSARTSGRKSRKGKKKHRKSSKNGKKTGKKRRKHKASKHRRRV